MRPIAQGLDYGRTVARVQCHGIDASEQQVRAGMAWVFDRYVGDRWLYWAQEDARAAHRGPVGRRAAGGAMGVAQARAVSQKQRCGKT